MRLWKSKQALVDLMISMHPNRKLESLDYSKLLYQVFLIFDLEKICVKRIKEFYRNVCFSIKLHI